jgi:hypothetical protein
MAPAPSFSAGARGFEAFNGARIFPRSAHLRLRSEMNRTLLALLPAEQSANPTPQLFAPSQESAFTRNNLVIRLEHPPVCTENLNSGVVVMESAKDGA